MWRPSDPHACERVDERLEAWVDGDLDATESRLVERHLNACDVCRRQAEVARAVASELRALPHFDAPEEVLQRVIRAASEARRDSADEPAAARRPDAGQADSRWGLARWGRWRIATVGALAAAGLLIAIVLLPGGWSVEGTRAASPASENVARHPATVEPPTGMPDEAEVRRAADEARLALAYLSRASRRAGMELRQELLIDRFAAPAAEGLRALGLEPRPEKRGSDEA